MSNYLTAGFNGSSGSLSGYTSDSGATWQVLLGSRDPKMYTGGGGIVANSGAASAGDSSLCRASVIAASADVSNTTTYSYDSINFGFIGAIERMNAAGTQGYLAAYANSVQKWGIWRLDGTKYPTNSASFAAASTATPYTNGATPSAVYTVTGTNPVNHKLVVDGVTLIDYNETGASRVTSAGYPGLYIFSGSGEGQGMFINSMSGDTVTAVDTTAPILTSPAASATSTTTATATIVTNEGNGTAYCLISTNSTESAATIRSTGQSQAVSATGTLTFNRTGLTANTSGYRAHFLQDDAAANASAVVDSATFATPAAGDTTPPTLSSPTGTKTGSTTATGMVTTNEATGVLRVLTTTNTSQTQAEVLASSFSQAVSASGVQNISRTGLTPGATLRHHYVHTDASGNSSTVASSPTFTLDASPVRTWTSAIALKTVNGVPRAGVAITAYINDQSGFSVSTKPGLTTGSDGKPPAYTTTAGTLATVHRVTYVEDAFPTEVAAVEFLAPT